MYPNITIKHDNDEETTVVSVTTGDIGVILNCYRDDDGAAIIDVKESRGKRVPVRVAFIADATRNDAAPPVTNSTDERCNNGVTVLRDAFNQIDSYFSEER